MNEVKKYIIAGIKGLLCFILSVMAGIALVNKSHEYYIYNDYSFMLIGNEEITLLEGEEYVEPGYRIISQHGIDLSNYVSEQNNLDIMKPGEYEIKYKSKYNRIKKKLVRKVNVIPKESINKWVRIPTYEGSSEVTHPKVLYFENEYNGYKYWMVNTPYPFNDAYYENPSIVVSNDGINWTEPKGINNPVSGYPNKIRDDSYYSDPFILYDGNKFELFFRKTKSYLNGIYKSNGYNYMYYINSDDGVNWTKPKMVMNNNRKEQYMSISIEKIDNIYKMWYVNYDGKIRYIESNDLITYTDPVDVNIESFNEKVWHKEIQYVKNKYICIFMIKYKLFYTESTDGINFSEPKEINTQLENINDENYIVYKASFVITDKYIELFIPYRVNYKWKMKYIKMAKYDFYKKLL